MNKIKIYLLALLVCFGIVSCKDDSPKPEPEPAIPHRALIVYMPWATNLYSAFRQNLDDLQEAIERSGLSDQRVLVYIADSHTSADLFEMKLAGGVCKNDTLKHYDYVNQETAMEYTTESGLTSLFNDFTAQIPALEYSMIIGCHGSGWLPVTRTFFDTRSFGGATDKYRTEISTLRKALENNHMKLEYLLFDDCYMANAEVAYELRNVTNHIIASTSEIMGYGMPYHTMGRYLLGKPDYQRVCDEFQTFYSNYSSPYGTISVTKTSEMDKLAAEMKKLNALYSISAAELENQRVQALDGYDTTVFYDCGDYISKLAHEAGTDALKVLEQAVPYKAHTDWYCSIYGSFFGLRTFAIKTFSGLTISDASINSLARRKMDTSWWQATH